MTLLLFRRRVQAMINDILEQLHSCNMTHRYDIWRMKIYFWPDKSNYVQGFSNRDMRTMMMIIIKWMEKKMERGATTLSHIHTYTHRIEADFAHSFIIQIAGSSRTNEFFFSSSHPGIRNMIFILFSTVCRTVSLCVNLTDLLLLVTNLPHANEYSAHHCERIHTSLIFRNGAWQIRHETDAKEMPRRKQRRRRRRTKRKNK